MGSHVLRRASRVAGHCSADTSSPLCRTPVAHSAMTHLSLDVRNDALLFLDVLVCLARTVPRRACPSGRGSPATHAANSEAGHSTPPACRPGLARNLAACNPGSDPDRATQGPTLTVLAPRVQMNHAPRLVAEGYLAPCLAHFGDLFSAPHRSRSIRAQSLAALTKLLVALNGFLARALPEPPSARAQAEQQAQKQQQPSGGDAAGPGPGSARERLLASLAEVGGVGRPAAAARLRWPARGAGELRRALAAALADAAAATRAGRARRGKPVAAAHIDGGVSKPRGKRGRGGVASSEAASAAFEASARDDAAAAAAGGSGKALAAAAAALATVAAPRAAAAAGVDLAAPSGAAAAAALGATTTMAAALAAAADARACALRLLAALGEAWLEVGPAHLATAPELEPAAALAMIASAACKLLELLLASVGADGGERAAALPAPGEKGGAEQRRRLLVLRQARVPPRVACCLALEGREHSAPCPLAASPSHAATRLVLLLQSLAASCLPTRLGAKPKWLGH